MKTLAATAPVLARYLAAVPPFGALGPADRQLLAAGSLLRRYDRGEALFRTGQPAEALLCLVRGSVRISRPLADGREKVIHLTRAPALVAEAPTLVGGCYPADGGCLDECLLVVIARRDLLCCAARAPELPWRLAAELFVRLRELTDSLAAHSEQSGVTRVASYLLGLAHDGDEVALPAPKKDVASYLGLRPESLSRALGTLQQQGAITLARRRIRIVDRGVLGRAPGA